MIWAKYGIENIQVKFFKYEYNERPLKLKHEARQKQLLTFKQLKLT